MTSLDTTALPATSFDGTSRLSVYVSPTETSLLGALAEMTARLNNTLNNTISADIVASEVLMRARDALGAVSCTVWLRTPDRIAQSWCVGDESLSTSELETILLRRREAPASLCIVDMRFGSRSVGTLSVRFTQQPTPEQSLFIATLANMLASCVANSERSRRLEGDLQVRMRENEEQRRFTEMIVDCLPLGLYVINRDYRITVWNHKREIGMQGVFREEAIGRTIFEVLHRQPREVLQREFDEIFSTGRMQQFQSESKWSGKLRTYRLSKIPMRDETGYVTHVITIGEDITDWVEARERVAQNEKLAAIGRLAAGIMHEINNPLATIAACAESMALLSNAEPAQKTVPVPSDGPEYIKIIESEVERCKRIIGGLLDFSRPQALQRQSLSVNMVIERALFLLNHHARFKQLSVELALSDTLPPVYANSEQLIQVVIALLMNAVDAMTQFGRVIVRSRVIDTTVAARKVVIEIEDEGTGISRSQMARIFEPFYTTKESGHGTGLGLAICYGIVAEHGGRMEVESEPGKGSVFRIILPAEDAEVVVA